MEIIHGYCCLLCIYIITQDCNLMRTSGDLEKVGSFTLCCFPSYMDELINKKTRVCSHTASGSLL